MESTYTAYVDPSEGQRTTDDYTELIDNVMFDTNMDRPRTHLFEGRYSWNHDK